MPHVVLTERIHADAVERLRAEPGFEITEANGVEGAALARLLQDADAVGVRIRRLDAGLLSAARRLVLIAKHGVGTDNIDLDLCRSAGIAVLNTPDANKIAVAEHAMMLILALAKRLHAYEAAVRSADWGFRDRLSAREVSGMTLAIVGFGRSGQELAARAKAFGMDVIAYSRSLDAETAARFGVGHAATLDDALIVADVLSLHVPGGGQGGAMIGARELALLRPGAFLVNCARGGVVDEAALAAALTSGHLAGAGIDVFAAEPPGSDDPLMSCRNVILTPHSAGNTLEASRRMGLEMADNIIDFFIGRIDPARIVVAGAAPPRGDQ